MRFHRGIAAAVLAAAHRYQNYPCTLSGGVFQNRTLLELLSHASNHVDLRFPGRIPINDGGLALGQLVVASARHQRQS